MNVARAQFHTQIRLLQRPRRRQITLRTMSLGADAVSQKAVAEQQEHGKVVKGGEAAIAQVTAQRSAQSSPC